MQVAFKVRRVLCLRFTILFTFHLTLQPSFTPSPTVACQSSHGLCGVRAGNGQGQEGTTRSAKGGRDGWRKKHLGTRVLDSLFGCLFSTGECLGIFLALVPTTMSPP